MSEDGLLPDAFNCPVFVEIDDEWICIEDVAQANDCLSLRFRTERGPSFRRALAACSAAIDGTGPIEMARVTFVVAAMEAGYRFDIIGDDAEAFERRIELEAQNGLLSILNSPSDDDDR